MKASKKKQHTLKWFINRIGKRIHRKPILSCGCKHCMKTSFIIWDGKGKNHYCRREFHARYLFDCQNDLRIEYSDKPIKNYNDK